MTTYNSSMIEWPWLTEDKLDAPISIRWAEWVNYYVAQTTRTNNQGFSINGWFRPKAVRMKAISTWWWGSNYSIWYWCEVDNILTVSTIYKNWNSMETLGTWAATSTYIMYHDPLSDPDFARRITLTQFTENWADFTVSLLWDDYILEVTLYR